VLAWHRYLATTRDPQGSGLVTIYHPWESGADNSPRWDSALANLEVGEVPEFRRRDTDHVADASQRPTDLDYRRYIWLVEALKGCHYDETAIQGGHPFMVKDVFFSALLVAANAALAELAELQGSAEDVPLLRAWAERGRQGLAAQWDEELELCVDYDLRAGRSVRTRTFAGFAPLIAGGLDGDREARLISQLGSADFAGHPGLRWSLLPSTSPEDPGFRSRSYWRGPTWPVIDWLVWRALRPGHPERADHIRREALAQVLQGGLSEYFEPYTGDPLGSARQSWTAAVALDWLAPW
jgi:hypothetical protein